MASSDASFDPARALLDWYDRHRRRLPWRTNPHPYAVLVSELLLQQTQVDRVIPYFERFTTRFPSFEALAAAPRAEVIRLWSGLGYNRRAVHLHETARIVVERYGGQLPADRQELQSLPGIGPYTASALLSIAFGCAELAADTNVRRVVSRYAFDQPTSERALEAAARKLVPRTRAGDWNQALMDLGSAICLGRKPRCLLCPLAPGCKSAGRVEPKSGTGTRPSDLYAGSSRFYRGRLLAALAELPAGGMAPFATICRTLQASGVAEPRGGWHAVGEALERDGLARIEPLGAAPGIGLA